MRFTLFSAPPVEEGKLNAASPEFIPRSLQGGAPQDMTGAASSKEWEESESPPPGDNQAGEWHDGMWLCLMVLSVTESDWILVSPKFEDKSCLMLSGRIAL